MKPMKPLSQAITYTMHRVQSYTVTVTGATVCNSPTCSFSPDQWLCWWGGRSWWARPAWLWASFRCTPAARPGNPDTGPARTARCRSMHCPWTLHTGKMGRGEVKGRGAHIQRQTDSQSRQSCSIVPLRGKVQTTITAVYLYLTVSSCFPPVGRQRRRKRVDLMSTSGETEKIW